MNIQEIHKELQNHFPGIALELVETVQPAVPAQKELAGDPHIVVPSENILEICKCLHLTDMFHFDCLSNLSAVDWKEHLDVVYHLFSYRHRHGLELKVKLPSENPRVQTLESIWKVANWFEREVYDLYGIHFEGHSDLTRILLPPDWIGHPLRKDYKEEAEYHGIETTRENPLK